MTDTACYLSLEGLIADTAPYCVPVYKIVYGKLVYDSLVISEEVFDSICERIQWLN